MLLLFQNIQIYCSRTLNSLPHFPRMSLISFHTKSGSYLEDYTPLPQQASHAVAAADDSSYDYQEEGYDDQYYEADQGTVEAKYDGNKGE
jgi:hypothetical protein